MWPYNTFLQSKCPNVKIFTRLDSRLASPLFISQTLNMLQVASPILEKQQYIMNTFTSVRQNHRLNASSSPVLMATQRSYGSPRLLDCFVPLGSRGQTLNGHSRKMAQTTCIHARMCHCAFCSKNCYFSYPLMSWHRNGQNLTNFWT